MSDQQDPLNLLRQHFPNPKPVTKAPMTVFGLIRNLFFVALFVGGAGAIYWGFHTSQPEYKWGQRLEEAQQLAKEGDPLAAAGVFAEVINSGYFTDQAKSGFERQLNPILQHADFEQRLRAYAFLGNHVGGADGFVPALYDRAVTQGLKEANELAEDQPEQALEVVKRLRIIRPGIKELPALDLKLLKRLVAKQPENTLRAVELALIYEQEENLEEAVKLLTPHRKKLGVTEGARLLGQLDLGNGNYEGAFQLLSPYVASKMKDLHRVEQSYTNTLDRVYREAIGHLQNGKASQDWYTRYDTASETEKANMVDEYTGAYLKNDARYQRALASFEKANEFVSVALDLGVAQLNRAQGIADQQARKEALSEARKTFLSIQSFAGRNNDYLLFMGQVNYWLGDSDEGRAQFEQLLAQTKRAFNIVIAVANTVREVGDVNWARELTEQAYTSTIKTAEMQNAARLRALMHKDTDDQIKWLELADPEAPDTIISLNTARGRKALEDDNNEEAARYFREAVRGYEKLPRNASTLNNKGLAYLDLYSVSGAAPEFMHGVELLDEAGKMSPDDAILIINSASAAMTAAFFEMLTNHYDFSVLKTRPDISMLSSLYENEAGRRQVHEQLRQSKLFKRAATQLDRSMVLSPKRVNSYVLSLEVKRSMRDLAGLQKLAQQIETAQPDVEVMRESFVDSYAADEDAAKTGARLRASLKEARKNLASLRDRKSRTAVYLRVQEIVRQNSLTLVDPATDITVSVAASRGLVQDVDNRATRGLLSQTLCLQAAHQLLKQHPSLVPLEKKTRNLLSPADFLTYLLEKGGEPARFLLGNAAAKEAAKVYQQIQDQFPDRPSPKSWAFVRHFDPGYAKGMVARMKQDEVSRLADELQYELMPYSASVALAQYYRSLATGDAAGAAAVYAAAINRGVPFPPR